MKFFFRTDASTQIGTGHVIRCLTLATALREAGHEIVFFCQPLKGNLISRVRDDHGFQVFNCSQSPEWSTEIANKVSDIDCLLVDHYGLDKTWESACRPFVKQIVVIDDLADRSHDCDLLIDQNFMPLLNQRYNGLTPEHCQLLLGPEYALLRPEFLTHRKEIEKKEIEKKEAEAKTYDGSVRRLMVSLGGADPNNATLKVLEGIALLPDAKRNALEVNVIVGAANPNPELIHEISEKYDFLCFQNIPDMAKKMGEVDLFIGAGGTTTWERFALGLPGIVISIAENHRELSRYLAEHAYQLYLGESETLEPKVLADTIHALCHCPEWVAYMRRRGMTLVDGQGTERVCQAIYRLNFQLVSQNLSQV